MLKNVQDSIISVSTGNDFDFSSRKILSKLEYEFYEARKTPIEVLKLRIKEHDEILKNDPYSFLKLTEIQGFEEYNKRREQSEESFKRQREKIIHSLNSLYGNKNHSAPDGLIVVDINSQVQKQVDEKKKAQAAKRKEALEKKKTAEKSRIENESSSKTLILAAPIESTSSNTDVVPQNLSLNEELKANSRSVLNKTISIEDRWQDLVGPQDSERLFKEQFTPEETSDTLKEITLIMLSTLDREEWYKQISTKLDKPIKSIRQIISNIEAKIIALASKFC